MNTHQVLSVKEFEFTHEAVRPEAYAAYVRVLRQNWRQGTVGSKTRAEVAFSNKKPWRQKGTGRARVGSMRSPLWRKGGTIFGPQERSRLLSIPREVKRAVLRTLVQSIVSEGRFIVLDGCSFDKPNTKKAVAVLQAAGVLGEMVGVFAHAHDHVTRASFSNIEKVFVLLFDEPNAYDISRAQYWVVRREDLDACKQMVKKWN